MPWANSLSSTRAVASSVSNCPVSFVGGHSPRIRGHVFQLALRSARKFGLDFAALFIRRFDEAPPRFRKFDHAGANLRVHAGVRDRDPRCRGHACDEARVVESGRVMDQEAQRFAVVFDFGITRLAEGSGTWIGRPASSTYCA
jgi:hypothetical protein